MGRFAFGVRVAGASALVLLAACSGGVHTAVVPPPGPPSVGVHGHFAEFAVPKACAGQKTASKFASLTMTLQSSGGSACIPAIGGFGGTVLYPTATPSIVVHAISSATNYNGRLPSLASGKPVFYLQLATNGAVTFGSSVPAGGGLTGAGLIPGKAYTAFGQATIEGFSVPLTPCSTVATKGKYGGVVAGFGLLLAGQQVPAAARGIIEIYPGRRVATPC